MAVTGMDVLLNLMGFGDKVVSAFELVLIECEIDGIVGTIEKELEHYKPEHFHNRGHIAAGSFGGGDRAPSLALHHTKAHAVMTDTLYGIRKDLLEYQQACRDARKFLQEADLTSAGDLNALTKAVEALSTGARSDHGADAYSQAQYAHRNDTTDGSES